LRQALLSTLTDWCDRQGLAMQLTTDRAAQHDTLRPDDEQQL
jgi:hypothetical protein